MNASESIPKIVIFIMGPVKVGKTILSNTLSDLSESLNSQEYHPTRGLRILESERKIILQGNKKNKKELTTTVEIWDCSGDTDYLPTWPSLASEAHGVIYVTSPESIDSLDIYQSFFPHLKSLQSLICLTGSSVSNPKKVKIQNKILSKSPITNFNTQENMSNEFDNLLTNAFLVYQENKDREETRIMGN